MTDINIVIMIIVFVSFSIGFWLGTLVADK